MKKLLALGVLLLVVACTTADVVEPAVTDLSDTAQLADIFNSADSETTQLILLLSPT